ncbi:DUF481 domain-containing protein [Thiomicrorhabdus sediminis]|nr:DUF481 domain-containing protein [Thiomicrorhabdus sediminis]
MFSFTRKTLSIAILSSISLCSTQAVAGEKTGFSGNGELGFSNSTGNTDSNALYAALKMQYLQARYDVLGGIEISDKSENGTQTESRYAIDAQYNRYYAEDKNFYSYLGGKLTHSKFEDIDLETTASVGLGKRLYKTERVLLTGQVGIGYQNTDYISATASEDQVVYQAKLDYSNQINNYVKFTQDLIVNAGNEQTKTEANTGLSVKIAEQMKLKASFKYRNNSNPAPGTEKTDTLTLVSVIYDF